MHPRDFSARTPDDFDHDNMTPDTCVDFWRMCAHLDTDIIVMLCQVQRGFTGCSQYFPAEKGDVVQLAEDVKVKALGNFCSHVPSDKHMDPKVLLILRCGQEGWLHRSPDRAEMRTIN